MLNGQVEGMLGLLDLGRKRAGPDRWAMDRVLCELFEDWNKERPRAMALSRVEFDDLEELDGLQQAGDGEARVVVEDC